MDFNFSVKTILAAATLTASIVGGGFETVKTAAPYFQNPPPFPSEQQVAQSLQAVQKGQALSNQRQTRDEHRLARIELRVNAAEMSTAASDLASLEVEARARPKDTILGRLLQNARQRLTDLQVEHDALRAEQ